MKKNALTTTHQVTDFSDAFVASIAQAQESKDATDTRHECPSSVPSAFINRTVAALDEAGMGEHSVYVHWARIDYGCWLDAEEVVNAGGIMEYLEALGMGRADREELLSQGWEVQAAEGLAARCLGDGGELDWKKLAGVLELMEFYFMAA